MAKTIKLGFFGLKSREKTIEAAKAVKGIKVVAFFDKCPAETEKYAAEFPNAVACKTIEEFLASGIDAAIIGECAKGRPDVACMLMKKGIAVMAGSMPARSLADCVKLCRTYEETQTKYMFATPMCFTASVLELKKQYEGGTFGKMIYGAGDYVCDGHDVCEGTPALLYGTRALLPLLYITGEKPLRIVSKIAFNHKNPAAHGCKGPDAAPVTLIELKSGALIQLNSSVNTWPKGAWYRIGTTKGGIETKRGAFSDVWVNYFKDYKPEGFGEESGKTYTAEYPADIRRKYKNLENDVIAEALMVSSFISYVKGEAEAPFDVYAAATVASILILGARSALEDGVATLLPDFTVEGIRKMYNYDLQTPVPDENGFASQPTRMKPTK